MNKHNIKAIKAINGEPAYTEVIQCFICGITRYESRVYTEADYYDTDDSETAYMTARGLTCCKKCNHVEVICEHSGTPYSMGILDCSGICSQCDSCLAIYPTDYVLDPCAFGIYDQNLFIDHEC